MREIRDPDPPEDEPADPVEVPGVPQRGPDGGGGADDLAVVGVVGLVRLRIQVEFREIRRIQAVESVEIVHRAVPVGQGRGETPPGNERLGVEHPVEIPGAAGGAGAGQGDVVDEIGIGRAVPVVEEVAEGAEIPADVGAVADVGHGNAAPARLDVVVLGRSGYAPEEQGAEEGNKVFFHGYAFIRGNSAGCRRRRRNRSPRRHSGPWRA